MLDVPKSVEEVSGCDPAALPDEVLNSTRPLVLRGLVSEWPAVRKGLASPHQFLDEIRRHYQGRPVSAFLGGPEIGGRFFYNEDLSGFNFHQLEADLNKILDKLVELETSGEPPTCYVGSTNVDAWLPGFREKNDINLDAFDPITSIWIGNRSRVAAHFDFPDNIACCALGRRRFTVFPPEQLPNLYVGPADLTPAGQQISLVDFASPDLELYPNFARAMAAAQVAELEAGDALFLPGMWWHHVEALDSINVLVNYWWTRSPAYLGSPADALTHAILGIKSLSPEQRQAWKTLFDHYVFDPPEDALDHIPGKARGRLGDIDEKAARRLRAELLNRLKQ
jgi:hypothetical protein